MLSLLFILACIGVVNASLYGPKALHSHQNLALGHPLRQTTRAEVVRRATRVERRATVQSPGLSTANPTNMDTFVLQFTQSGDSAVDGIYAVLNGGFIDTKGDAANAQLFHLDDDSYLRGPNGGYALAYQFSAGEGGAIFMGSPSSHFYQVQCSISAESTLSCSCVNGPQATYQIFFQPQQYQPNLLIGTAGAGFAVPVIVVYNASP